MAGVHPPGQLAERVELAPTSNGVRYSSTSRRAASALKSGSRPPAPLYCTAAQSPWATEPSSSSSITDNASPACRIAEKPGVIGVPDVPEAVVFGTRPDRRLVVGEESGADRLGEDLDDSHSTRPRHSRTTVMNV